MRTHAHKEKLTEACGITSEELQPIIRWMTETVWSAGALCGTYFAVNGRDIWPSARYFFRSGEPKVPVSFFHQEQRYSVASSKWLVVRCHDAPSGYQWSYFKPANRIYLCLWNPKLWIRNRSLKSECHAPPSLVDVTGLRHFSPNWAVLSN